MELWDDRITVLEVVNIDIVNELTTVEVLFPVKLSRYLKLD